MSREDAKQAAAIVCPPRSTARPIIGPEAPESEQRRGKHRKHCGRASVPHDAGGGAMFMGL